MLKLKICLKHDLEIKLLLNLPPILKSRLLRKKIAEIPEEKVEIEKTELPDNRNRKLRDKKVLNKKVNNQNQEIKDLQESTENRESQENKESKEIPSSNSPPRIRMLLRETAEREEIEMVNNDLCILVDSIF